MGWFEQDPEPSFRLIEECHLPENASILNVGSGASTMVEKLLTRGFQNIIASDISSSALELHKKSLGPDRSKNIQWIVDDLCEPKILQKLGPVDLWHDRAVLHFFQYPAQQEAYFRLLKDLVKKDGFVIIAAFSLKGATQCSGLPVKRYSKEMLEESLGSAFHLQQTFDYTFTNPSGNTREYIYTQFQRKV